MLKKYIYYSLISEKTLKKLWIHIEKEFFKMHSRNMRKYDFNKVKTLFIKKFRKNMKEAKDSYRKGKFEKCI